MRCRHKYETLQQTIRNGQIVADICRCVKCGIIREMHDTERPIGPHIENEEDLSNQQSREKSDV